jgi:hypothetical protein
MRCEEIDLTGGAHEIIIIIKSESIYEVLEVPQSTVEQKKSSSSKKESKNVS